MEEQISEERHYMTEEHFNTIRLSLPDFLTLARNYVASIVASLDTLQYAYKLLARQDHVWPDQCDYAISSIRTMDEPIRDLSALLDKTSQLPVTVVPLRYQLLTELRYLEDQLRRLLLVVTTLRSTCRVPSKQSIKQKHEILQRLETILEEGEGIAYQSNELFDQARFQERRQDAINTEKPYFI